MQYKSPIVGFLNYKNGVDGRSYVLHSSTDILQIQKNGVIHPSYIDFNSYYRDGQSTNKKEFFGIFVIEESYDDVSWNTIYESEVPENSVRHIIYDLLTNANGDLLTLKSGVAMGIPRKITSVRCTLYNTDKSAIIDSRTIMVFKDAAALTQEEIFNILTDNGKVKGIYKHGKYKSYSNYRNGKWKENSSRVISAYST